MVTHITLNFGLTCFIVIGSILVANGSQCFNCNKVTDPTACKNFNPCKDGERCFKETVETEAGTAEYNWGCASKQLCTLESNLSFRRKRLGIERCYECCDGDFCNYGACVKDFCASVNCDNNATCRNTAIGPVCDCLAGYTGQLCEAEINECSPHPCQNNGTCTDLLARYECACVLGFTGQNCETNIDECASNKCKNGATCVDAINSFSCVCPPGYTGTFCETDINECLSSPCQYNSTCVDKVNGYECRCPSGIIGINCEIDIDECQNVTCLNGGTCNDHINSFTCSCLLGFDGTYCGNYLGRVCYDCDGVGQVDMCKNETLCGTDEECFMEHELVSPNVFNFNMGCVPKRMCDYLQSGHQSGPIIRRKSVAIQLCYECCNGNNGCNHHACLETRFATTTRPTTSRPTTTMTTTSKPATSKPTTTTATTTTTTTSKPATTMATTTESSFILG